MVGPLLIKLIVRNGKKKVKRNFKFWDLWDILKKKKKKNYHLFKNKKANIIYLCYTLILYTFFFLLVICTLFGTK